MYFTLVIIFKSALSGPLKSIIKLNDEEIQFLVSYFENSNGQVPYGQFCEIIHNDLPKINEGMMPVCIVNLCDKQTDFAYGQKYKKIYT